GDAVERARRRGADVAYPAAGEGRLRGRPCGRAEDRGRRRAAEARPVLTGACDRGHPLQRKPRVEGDRRRRRRRAHQPRQHRRARQGRARRQVGEEGWDSDAHRGELRLTAEAPRRPCAEGSGPGAPRGGAPGGAGLGEVRLLEQLDFHDFKISVKSSHVPTMIRAYRLLASKVPYPLHLGVTEAGTPYAGSIKSAVGIGALLVDGIGDTIRVSLTARPVEEGKAGLQILKALGRRGRGPIMIACPSCGRDNVGVQRLAERVEERLGSYPEAFEVAVLGCAVNGPGEAGDADFGIAGGRDVGFIYAHGRVLKKVSSDILVDELFHAIDKWIADGM